MPEHQFPHLMANEPTTVELTLKEYEEYRNPKQPGRGTEGTKDVPKAVEPDTSGTDGTPFSGTRAEAIKILQERGFEYKHLRSKRRDELIDML